MNNHPIVIMYAMEVEADFLIAKLENIKIEKIEKYKFYEGTINSYPIVICHCNEMSINAAVATYISIQKYNPIAIISQGIAGGHGENIHKGDIVIGEKCINIVSSQTPFKKMGEGSNSLEWDLVNFISGEDNRLEYQYADNSLIKYAKKIPYTDGNVHIGTLGSGDVWNKEIDKILWLNQKYGTLCEDMESISIYRIANDFNIPIIGIRVISNNEILQEVYDRNLALKSQEFTYELVLKIIK